MEIFMNELTTELPYELPKNMKFIKELDHGSFGQVILVRECQKNIDLAIKVINKIGAGFQTMKKMKEEISILKKLNHENIVKFYGYIETNSQLLIEMEYIKYGTLSRWMKENKRISEKEASLLLGKVLSAVEYLHNLRICHRDIKPENIMFSKMNDFASIKIIDFGLSAQHFNCLYNNEYCGTYIYMAPEQIQKKLYYYSIDIWSIGILMFMLLNNGKHPFYLKGDTKEDFIQKIKERKINFINKVSYMAKNLIYKLCEPNPSWRYSASHAIKHPWITRNAKDDIPLTFNEILTRNNNKKNAMAFMMISIFLNYAKKNATKDNKLNFKKRTNNRIFKINYDYINQCEIINKEDRERNEKLKERYLEVLSTDEEDSFEKKENKHINKKKFNTIMKELNSPKKYHAKDKEPKTPIIKPKNMNKVNSIHDISGYLKQNIFDKYNQQLKFKERKKSSYCCRLLSMPNKYKNMKLIKKEKMINNSNNLNLSKNNLYKSNKNINPNRIILNQNEKNRLKNQKNNSSCKIIINKITVEDKNSNTDVINKLDKTPQKIKFFNKKNKYKLMSNPSDVPKLDNNFSKISNKNLNNFTRNYNIIPLVLPFIGIK